jgi:Ca2+-binding EF-hand superfamily protein
MMMIIILSYSISYIYLLCKGIALNPFNDRICQCFNLNNDDSKIDFKQFLIGLALFNSPGRREAKLRLAFTIQDFDNDGVINKEDLCIYLRRSTTRPTDKDNVNVDNNTSFNEEVIQDIVKEVLRESSSDPKQEQLSFADFQRIVASLDFQAKLVLPI